MRGIRYLLPPVCLFKHCDPVTINFDQRGILIPNLNFYMTSFFGHMDQKLTYLDVMRFTSGRSTSLTSCRRAAAMICPRPGLQRKRAAAAALSQAGRARPDQPIRAIQPAGRTRRPPTGCTRQTSDRQTSDSIIA